ncbi:MAG: hypothetical protein ABSB22_04520 [Thermodesulfobacteriota bacterium]|jgi:hypothetical protein
MDKMRRRTDDLDSADLLTLTIDKLGFVELFFARLPADDGEVPEDAAQGLSFLLQDIIDDLRWCSDNPSKLTKRAEDYLKEKLKIEEKESMETEEEVS